MAIMVGPCIFGARTVTVPLRHNGFPRLAKLIIRPRHCHGTTREGLREMAQPQTQPTFAATVRSSSHHDRPNTVLIFIQHSSD